MAIPWRSIFTSLPVWGIVLGHAASNWGNYTLNQQLPTYLTDVLRFDLSYTGLLSSMCYVLQWIGRATWDRKKSIFIGDRITDMMAAKKSKLNFILFKNNSNKDINLKKNQSIDNLEKIC